MKNKFNLDANIYEIVIVTSEGSWMLPYSKRLKEKIEVKWQHSVRLVQNINHITSGELCFLLGCFDILPSSLLGLNRHNLVVHESDLPQGRGWSPMTWQIIEGKNEVKITLFEAIDELDAGDIYLQDTIKLEGHELIEEWRKIVGETVIEMCLNFIEQYPEILQHKKKQNGEPSYYPRRVPSDSELDMNKSLWEQFNLLRVVDNNRYPAFFYYQGYKYILKIEKENNS